MAGSGTRRTLAQRLPGAVARRARALWRRWFYRGPEFPAEAALDWLIRALDGSPAELRAICRETLLDYGCADIVAAWSEDAASMEPADVSRPPAESVRKSLHPSSSALAQAAAYWYSQHEADQADTAFRLLEARQTSLGHFPSPPEFFPDESARDRILAAKHYLDAASMRVSAAFDRHGQELPHTIDSSDGRMVAVCRWFAMLPSAAAVADVGCGSGRFLLQLAERFPGTKLTGIDPCSTLLDRLPEGIGRHRGTLLRTNLAEAVLDGAYAVESLEHCLVARRGVAELCRIVRPGGRVLVIDKHRSRQALSECEPWERWFHPHELASWLGPFCDDIRVEPVPHGEGLGTEGLFLAASGRRR